MAIGHGRVVQPRVGLLRNLRQSRQGLVVPLCVLLLVPSAIEALAYSCTMTVRSTIESIDGLDDHGYRIFGVAGGYELQQRSADGSWFSQGIYALSEQQEFTVFTHIPGMDENAPSVSILAIHQSGRASLTTHFGSWGNTSQYQKAWLIQGVCGRSFE